MVDVDGPAARAARRAELRAVALGGRLLGLALIAVAAVGLVTTPDEPYAGGWRTASWVALAAGWAVLIGVIVVRTRRNLALRRAVGPR